MKCLTAVENTNTHLILFAKGHLRLSSLPASNNHRLLWSLSDLASGHLQLFASLKCLRVNFSAIIRSLLMRDDDL